MNRRVILSIVLLGSSCSVGELDIREKGCPCAEDYICNPCANRCVPTGQLFECDGANDPAAAVQISALSADWATPNQAHWGWSVAAESIPDQLAGYELTIAETEQELIDKTGSARTFDAARNPELGRFYLPRATGDDVVTGTLVDGLAAGTSYVARLVAVDSAGRRSVSNLATTRTQDEAVLGSAVIFDDMLASGAYGQPTAEFSPATDQPFQGSHCYRWQQQNECAACWENLRFSNIDKDLSAVSEGALATSAYVEFSVSVDAATPSYWSEARFIFTDSAEPLVVATFAPITYRTISNGDSYRTYQVPLRAFVVRKTKQPLNDLSTYPMSEFGIGGLWDKDAIIRVDEARVFW